MAGRYGDKAGWLKKKKGGKPWTTEFCVVRGSVFEIYPDDDIGAPPVDPFCHFSALRVSLQTTAVKPPASMHQPPFAPVSLCVLDGSFS